MLDGRRHYRSSHMAFKWDQSCHRLGLSGLLNT